MGNGKALQDRIGESLHGFRNLGGCLPDSSRLVCQGLVEEGEGLLPSPPATSKIEVAHRKREVGTSGWGEGLGPGGGDGGRNDNDDDVDDIDDDYDDDDDDE